MLMKKILTLFFFLSSLFSAQIEANNFWNDVAEEQVVLPENAEITQLPNQYRVLALDFQGMIETLRTAPMENTADAPIQFSMPLPNGAFEVFEIVESPIFAPGLAAKYPQIKTFAGKSVENPSVTIRMDYSSQGFNAILHTNGGTVLINPYASGQTQYYISFDIQEVDFGITTPQHACQVKHDEDVAQDYDLPRFNNGNVEDRSLGDPINLHKYRLAVATTAEFYSSHGNSIPNVLASVTTIINNVNSILEKDVAIRLELIDNVEAVFFSNPVTDGFTNGNPEDLNTENFFALNTAFTQDGYDIGHVFGTNAGGLAQTGGVCNDNAKARASSSTFGAYAGALFYIIVAHEMGHQFSALHNFNFCDADNESWTTGFEPGSGSTIMCYAGASDCGPNYVQAVDDDYYHINAITRIRNFSRNIISGGSCAEVISTDNTTPTASVNDASGFFIPILTPFELTGSGTDDEDNNFLYNWEQYDAADTLAILGMPVLNSPAFRSYPPTNNPTRIFPKISTIVNNASDITEVLVDYSRDFTFRFSVRDCHPGGGGFDFADVAFQTIDGAGPFLVNSPNDGTETWEVGDYVEVTWDVSNTDIAPVNCQRVNIYLSTDGGFNYPITLAENTANDGSQFIVVPDEVGANVRVKVKAADNIFFDISNANFEIVPASTPNFAFNAPIIEGESLCLPSSVDIELTTAALAGFSEMITLSVAGLPAGATATFTPEMVMPGESSILTIDFPDDTAIGGDVALTIQATASGVDAQERSASYFLIANDFSALALQSPADGASGQSVLQTFDWSDVSTATSFDFEIATDPSFDPGSIIHSETGITTSNYDLSITLDENQAYFWRVRAANECGEGDFTEPYSLHTLLLECNQYLSTDGPFNISAQGTPTIESRITISDNVELSDVNVFNMKGNHDLIADMEFRLKAPDDETIVLFSDPGCFSTNFDMGFDDESPLTAPSPCATTGGVVYQSKEPLSTFVGKNALGLWTLEADVVNDLGNGGTFTSWELELCGGKNASNPELINNIALRIPPGDNRLIRQDSLLVEDADNSSSELEYTIVTAPEYGTLLLNGNPVAVGGTFTQNDINNQIVRYMNTDITALTDGFSFIVRDGEGGFLGTPRYEIIIDPDAPVNTIDVDLATKVSLYPNPAGNYVNIEFEQIFGSQLELSVYNVQGQLIETMSFVNFERHIQLNTEEWANGFYTITMKTDLGVVAKKLTVNK